MGNTKVDLQKFVLTPPNLRVDFTEFIGYQCHNSFLHGVMFYDEEGKEYWYDKCRTEGTTDTVIERLERMKSGQFALFISYQNPPLS